MTENNDDGLNKKDVKKNLNDEYVDINENKRGIDRQISEAKFYGRQWLNGFKTATVTAVIGGLIFLACLILAPYYLTIYFDKHFHSGFYGFAIGFGGTILAGLIISVLYRNIRIRIARTDKNAVRTTGVVVASSYLASHRLGSGSGSHESRKVLGVIYKVKIKVGKRTSIGYSKNRYYESGEEIEILFNPKRFWRCYIPPED
ncbi:MAG: hypothetical protein K2N22_02905 [Clostridia bacterium]|nr:hypothetical protein [Clostridia bacterium]